MRGTKAKAIRAMTYLDRSLREPRTYTLQRHGIQGNRMGEPVSQVTLINRGARREYLLAKKLYA